MGCCEVTDISQERRRSSNQADRRRSADDKHVPGKKGRAFGRGRAFSGNKGTGADGNDLFRQSGTPDRRLVGLSAIWGMKLFHYHYTR